MQNNHSIPASFDQAFGYSEDPSEHLKPQQDTQPAPTAAANQTPDPIATSKTPTFEELLHGKWNDIFGVKPDVVATPTLNTAAVEAANVVKTVQWQVPADSQGVTVEVHDKNGRLLNTYTISDYISLPPGTILKVRSI